MTYDDDMMRLNLSIGSHTIPVQAVGFEWPPPEHIYLSDGDGIREARPDDQVQFVMRRVSMSQITDDQRATMTHVFRGAEYEYAEEWPP